MPSPFVSMPNVIAAPAVRSLVPEITGVDVLLFGPEVMASSGGVLSCASVTVLVAVLPDTVTEATTGRLPSGRAERSEAVVDQVPFACTVAVPTETPPTVTLIVLPTALVV